MEPEDRIRDTRKRMSKTLDEIEYRISPNHLKHEAKEFMYDELGELRRDYHPQRIAKKAGTNMKNTISEHPISSVIAGLSLGYLLVKSGEEREHRKHSDAERTPYRSPKTEHPRKGTRREREESDAGEQIRAAGEEVSEKTQEMTQEATEQAHEMKKQAEEWTEETGRQARRQARSAKHSVERKSHQVQGLMEDFLFQNPLLAGTVALGTGALLGGMFPSTRTEDEWMGETRNDVLERAEEATEDTVRRASEAAENVAEDAKSAAKDLAHTSKEEAEKVMNEDKESGQPAQENGQDKTDRKKKSASPTK